MPSFIRIMNQSLSDIFNRLPVGLRGLNDPASMIAEGSTDLIA